MIAEMKKIHAYVFVGFLVGITGCGGETSVSSGTIPETTPRMIGNDKRKAVYYECWYALRSSYLTTPNDSGPTGGLKIKDRVASDWNYLGNDPNAFSKVQATVGSGNASVSSYFGTSDNYGKHVSGGTAYGRGGQCTYFGCLILYRALNGFMFNSNTDVQRDSSKGRFYWGDLDPARYPKATDAQPGDLVFTKSGTFHLAVCVGRPDSKTMDVVESNFTGYNDPLYSVGTYNGASNSELVARRRIDISGTDSGGYRAIFGDSARRPDLHHRRWY